MRTPISILCAAALCLAPFAPAAAEPEPDNALWEATGPVQTDTITGTIADTSDRDWYMLYVAANTSLTLTLQPSCTGQELTLRDADGQQLAVLSGSGTLPMSMTYPVGPSPRQFLLLMRTRKPACAGTTYTLNLSPPSSLLPGPPMATATPLGEAGEEGGPLAGDTWYQAELPVGDQDAYFFYADSAFTVKAVTSRCGLSAMLGEDGGEPDVAVAEVGSSQHALMVHTPSAWQKFHVSFSLVYPDPSCTYRFLITPASAVKSGPPPLTPPTPSTPPTTKVNGLKYKKVGKRVIVRWKPLQGATGYEARYTFMKKYGSWSYHRKTQMSFKAKIVPKKGMKVQVRARNDDGVGPKRTIRVRL